MRLIGGLFALPYACSTPSQFQACMEENAANYYDSSSVSAALWLLGQWDSVVAQLTSAEGLGNRCNDVEATLLATSCVQRLETQQSTQEMSTLLNQIRRSDETSTIVLASAFLSLAKAAALSDMEDEAERLLRAAGTLALMALGRHSPDQFSPYEFFHTDRILTSCGKRRNNRVIQKTAVNLGRYAAGLRSATRSAINQLPHQSTSLDVFNLNWQGSEEWLDRSMWAVMMLRQHCVPQGAPITIADCGSGSCRIAPLLDALGCAYTYDPYDLVPQLSIVQHLDIAAEPLPKTYHVALLLGVIEYLPDPASTLKHLSKTCQLLVFTHVYKGGTRSYTNQRLEELGWITHLTVEELRTVLCTTGFDILDERIISYNTVLLVARSTNCFCNGNYNSLDATQ